MLQRFITNPVRLTVPFAKCIDMEGFKVSTMLHVYRAEGFTHDGVSGSFMSDPMYMQQWTVFSNGGTMYNLNNYLLNYLSYNTMLQMSNTVSTDMSFVFDKATDKLYINASNDFPTEVTLEFIPVYEKVEDIKSDYWKDILIRMSIAQTKILLGRIRSRYTQSNALWAQDGETLLNEGNTDLRELMAKLEDSRQVFFPID